MISKSNVKFTDSNVKLTDSEVRMASQFCDRCEAFVVIFLLDSVFVVSRIIKVSVSVISLSLRLRLITLPSTLIILDMTKTSSNNCLELSPNGNGIRRIRASSATIFTHNHKYYDFLDCEWFRKLRFSTVSVPKLLLDSFIYQTVVK